MDVDHWETEECRTVLFDRGSIALAASLSLLPLVVGFETVARATDRAIGHVLRTYLDPEGSALKDRPLEIAEHLELVMNSFEGAGEWAVDLTIALLVNELANELIEGADAQG